MTTREIQTDQTYLTHRCGLMVAVDPVFRRGDIWRCWVHSTREMISCRPEQLKPIGDDAPDLDAGTGGLR